jgi:hypothetical protein
MPSRYNKKPTYINDDPRYKEFIKERGVKKINQYAFDEMEFPTAKQISQLTIVKHVWAVGSKLYKLAHEHYNDPTLWWVIAWFNKKPTEAHYKEGDVVSIPLPLERVYEILDI